MTAAVLISMIFSFFVSQPADLVPEDPSKTAQQIIEKLDGFKIELSGSCPRSFSEFVAARAELKKVDAGVNVNFIN